MESKISTIYLHGIYDAEMSSWLIVVIVRPSEVAIEIEQIPLEACAPSFWIAREQHILSATFN